jgi:hypothetical protein
LVEEKWGKLLFPIFSTLESDYPLFYHLREKKRFEVQSGELWTVESL